MKPVLADMADDHPLKVKLAMPVSPSPTLCQSAEEAGSRCEGSTLIFCGVDEAGRGPLAGPVYAAAVILNDSRPIAGLADSKKLGEKRRDKLALEIKQHALAWAIAEASVEEIDAINILRASLLAMRRAVEALAIRPQEVWVDGLHCPETGLPSRAIVQGDSSVAAISAASILAKTARDAAMLLLHKSYPQYGFDGHKGYPTAAHIAALRLHGVSDVHRRSFRPVRELLHRDSLKINLKLE